MTKRIVLSDGTRLLKSVKLLDGNGNKLTRKVRRDSKGLYVINYGSKGRLVTVKTIEDFNNGIRVLTVTRRVDHYIDGE